MRRLQLSCLALVLLALGTTAPAALATERLVRVDLDAPRLDLPILEQKLGLDVTHNVRATYADVLLKNDAELQKLQDNGFTYTVRIADGAAQAERARKADQRAAETGRLSALPSGRETYRTYQNYLDEMDALAGANPGLVRRFTLPTTTVEGRPITGVEISEGVTRTDDGKPVFVTMGVHHAREWPSAEMNIEFARDLVDRYNGGDPRWTRLLQRTRVFVIPVINVDGFLVSRGLSETTLGGAQRNRRKNCAFGSTDTATEACATRLGVDLNRNYGAYWGGNGASTAENNDTYRGPGLFSEPESRAVHEFSQRLQIMNFQTIHNVAALVLRPPGFRSQGLAPDEAGMKALGDAMGEATGYSSEYGYQLYEVTGATEDWNYDAQGAYAYTIETGGNNFNTDTYDLGVVQQYNGTPGTATEGRGVREALLLAAEQAQTTDDHGILAGNAPAGATLRLRKDFMTTTSPICQNSSVTVPVLDPDNGVVYMDCAVTNPAQTFADYLDTTITVPDNGRFTWHVGPSTRPFVGKAGNTEMWTLTCEIEGTTVSTRTFEVERGEVVTTDPCVDSPTTTAIKPPVTAVTEAPSALTSSTATLTGAVNPNGDPATARFEYGTTTAYGTRTAVKQAGDAATPTPVAQAITGLQPETTYHYRVIATGRGEGAPVVGEDQTFTTPALEIPAPLATTLDATDVTDTTARLGGTGDPNTRAATLRFEYGTTTAYGETTPDVEIGNGDEPVIRTAALAGLQPQTTYHYRTIVTSDGGTVRGPDRTFTTLDAVVLPTPPTVDTLDATDVEQTTATLRGTADLRGVAGTVRFDYGTTSALGSLTPAVTRDAGAPAGPASAELSGLSADTAYMYRLVAQTADGTTTGPLRVLRTRATPAETPPAQTVTQTQTVTTPPTTVTQTETTTTPPTTVTQTQTTTTPPTTVTQTETTSSPPTTVTVAGAGAAPSPTVPPAFRSSFAVDRQLVSSVRARGLRVRTRCSAACFLQLSVTFDRATVARLGLPSATLGRRTVRYAGATRRVLAVQPFTAVRRALRGKRDVPATVKVVVTTADGTRSTRTLKVTLR